MLMFLSAIAIAALAYWNTSMPAVYFYPLMAIVVFTIGLLVYHALKGFAYFAFEQVGDVLIFKYYATGNFSFKRMKISVSQTDYAGCKTQQLFGGLRKELVIYEWMNDKKAAYLPLSISLLTASQQQSLINTLQQFAR